MHQDKCHRILQILAFGISAFVVQKTAVAQAHDGAVWQLGETVSVKTKGSLRLHSEVVNRLSLLPANGSERHLAPEEHGYRLRTGGELTGTNLGLIRRVTLGLDGQLFGTKRIQQEILDAEPGQNKVKGDLDYRVSELALTLDVSLFRLRVGIDRVQFGMGVFANGGNDIDPHQVRTSPFGTPKWGDRQVRALIAAFPLGAEMTPSGLRPPLVLMLGGGRVIADDRSSAHQGDETDQYFAGLSLFLGLQKLTMGTVFRDQLHHEGGRSEAFIQVISAELNLLDMPSVKLTFDADAAILRGRSTLSESVFDTRPMSLESMGGVMRVNLQHHLLEATFEAGLATGDDDPFDRRGTHFRFDPEYRVGVLLFSQVQRFQTAQALANVSDPEYRGQPPRGAESIATQGGIENARYFNPRIGIPILDDLTLTLGYLYAVTDRIATDPFQTGLAGGQSRSHYGRHTRFQLGSEGNVGLAYTFRANDNFTIRGHGWYARLLPGSALRSISGLSAEPIDGFGVNLEALW